MGFCVELEISIGISCERTYAEAEVDYARVEATVDAELSRLVGIARVPIFVSI